jgi:hypothetical protein
MTTNGTAEKSRRKSSISSESMLVERRRLLLEDFRALDWKKRRPIVGLGSFDAPRRRRLGPRLFRREPGMPATTSSEIARSTGR